jgi:hypothetical protein
MRSASVCVLKSAVVMPARFFGDQAKPNRPVPADRRAYVCAET